MITKTSVNIKNIDYSAGEAILIDKEIGYTSFNAVYRIRKITKTKKVGHAGTLDPNASGLLILCTGKKTKQISEYQNFDKVYTGTFIIGKKTASYDSETDIIEENDFSKITSEDISKAAQKFVGKISQIPPMYSAIKKNGKSLYKYARKGIEIARPSREVTIHKFEIMKINLPEIMFRIKCSKGTYIRSIANDFGEALGCGAYLSSLRRTEIGDYSVEDAITLNEFYEKYNLKP